MAAVHVHSKLISDEEFTRMKTLSRTRRAIMLASATAVLGVPYAARAQPGVIRIVVAFRREERSTSRTHIRPAHWARNSASR